MTPELISIITVGMVLAGLIIGLFAWLRHDIREQGARLDRRIDDLRHDSNRRFDDLAGEVKEQGHVLSEIRERLSRLEGLIEGLFRPRPVMPPPTPDQHDQAA